MRNIDITELDANLANEIYGKNGYQAFECADPSAADSTNCGYHIVFSAEDQRGGIVYVGSGSSGETRWTDAISAQQVVERYMSNDMRA